MPPKATKSPSRPAVQLEREDGSKTPPHGPKDYGPSALKQVLRTGSWYLNEVSRLVAEAGNEWNDTLPELPTWANRIDTQDEPMGIVCGYLRVPAGVFWEALVLFIRANLASSKKASRDMNKDFAAFELFLRIFLIAKYFCGKTAMGALLGPTERDSIFALTPKAEDEHSRLPVRPEWEVAQSDDRNCNKRVMFDMIRYGALPAGQISLALTDLTTLRSEEGETFQGLDLPTTARGIVSHDCADLGYLYRISNATSPKLLQVPQYPASWQRAGDSTLPPGIILRYGAPEGTAPVRPGTLVKTGDGVEYYTGLQNGQLISPTDYDPNHRRDIRKPPGELPGRLMSKHHRTFAKSALVLQWDQSQNDLSCLGTPSTKGVYYDSDLSTALGAEYVGTFDAAPENYIAPHFPKMKNKNLVGTPLTSFPAVAWNQANGVYIKTTQGTFAAGCIFRLTEQWKERFKARTEARRAEYQALMAAGPPGIKQAHKKLEAHAELQTFNEEQDLHHNNAEVPMGAKLPSYRFDQTHMSKRTRKEFSVTDVRTGYSNADLPPALASFVQGAHHAFCQAYPTYRGSARTWWNSIEFLKQLFIVPGLMPENFSGGWISSGGRGNSQFPEASLDQKIFLVGQWRGVQNRPTFARFYADNMDDEYLPDDQGLIMSHQVTTLADEQWYLAFRQGYREADQLPKYSQLTVDRYSNDQFPVSLTGKRKRKHNKKRIVDITEETEGLTIDDSVADDSLPEDSDVDVEPDPSSEEEEFIVDPHGSLAGVDEPDNDYITPKVRGKGKQKPGATDPPDLTAFVRNLKDYSAIPWATFTQGNTRVYRPTKFEDVPGKDARRCREDIATCLLSLCDETVRDSLGAALVSAGVDDMSYGSLVQHLAADIKALNAMVKFAPRLPLVLISAADILSAAPGTLSKKHPLTMEQAIAVCHSLTFRQMQKLEERSEHSWEAQHLVENPGDAAFWLKTALKNGKDNPKYASDDEIMVWLNDYTQDYIGDVIARGTTSSSANTQLLDTPPPTKKTPKTPKTKQKPGEKHPGTTATGSKRKREAQAAQKELMQYSAKKSAEAILRAEATSSKKIHHSRVFSATKPVSLSEAKILIENSKKTTGDPLRAAGKREGLWSGKPDPVALTECEDYELLNMMKKSFANPPDSEDEAGEVDSPLFDDSLSEASEAESPSALAAKKRPRTSSRKRQPPPLMSGAGPSHRVTKTPTKTPRKTPASRKTRAAFADDEDHDMDELQFSPVPNRRPTAVRSAAIERLVRRHNNIEEYVAKNFIAVSNANAPVRRATELMNQWAQWGDEAQFEREVVALEDALSSAVGRTIRVRL